MIIVLDNVTTVANAAYLETLLIDQPWYYLKSTAYNQFENKRIPYESSWVNMIFNNDEVMNPIMSLSHSILIKALYEKKLSISKLVRIRAGLMTKTPHPVIHAPHVDWDNSHMTALYYVNDADGDTIFYKEKRDPNLEISSYKWSEGRKFNIDRTVTPKADRMVIFDGSIYHSSTSPSQSDYRIVLNFNFLP
jgi:hypothetical protein